MLKAKLDKNFTTLNLKPKLILLAAISLAGMLIVLMLFLNAITKSLYYEREMQTHQLIETGNSVIKHFHNLQVNGELSKSQAQNRAMDILRSTTYGDNGYFWINDTNGIMLMHPYTPEYIGKSMLEFTDKNGKKFFVDIVRVAKSGGGLVEYYWPKPGFKDAKRKLSNVILFKPWDWVLGTGIYLDDIENEIKLVSYRALWIIVIVFILISLVSMYVSKHFLNEMCELAQHDPLTSLQTRRSLSEEIPGFISSPDRKIKEVLAVIFLDIDFFKKINDTYGHSYGDKVLAQVGKSILQSIRPNDIGVRFGGEEFVIIMLCDSENEAVIVASRIREAVNKVNFEYRNKSFSITLSGGIAIRSEGEVFEDLLQRADNNLYKAKEAGRDRLCY
jgi:diguanylate cyclase (GGDEF)-like protein